MKHTKNHVVLETIESRELELYADNERDIYADHIVPVVRNLTKHYKRGTFDETKAIDAFFPVACAAARKYARDFASLADAPKMFDVTARYTAAAKLLERYMDDIVNGGL